MANTTFSGPVRSESTFKAVSKSTSTGAITEITTYGGAPVALADANASLTNATHSGRTLVVPALAANRTLTLPSPVAGASFKLVYGGAAEETENLIIDTGSDTNFYLGGVLHITGTPASVYADGNSNSILTLTDFGLMEINIAAKDTVNWYIWGYQQGADAPAFTDQS